MKKIFFVVFLFTIVGCSSEKITENNSETKQSIRISQSGDYFVTISNSCGSVTSDTEVVIINPIPNTPLITANGPTTFCIGDSVILSSSNPNNNIWSNGETTQSITVSTDGTFSVTVQSSQIGRASCRERV